MVLFGFYFFGCGPAGVYRFAVYRLICTNAYIIVFLRLELGNRHLRGLVRLNGFALRRLLAEALRSAVLQLVSLDSGYLLPLCCDFLLAGGQLAD